MRLRISLLTMIILLSFGRLLAQTAENTSIQGPAAKHELKGQLLDSDTQSPLPYGNIYVLHKNRGGISNESGYYSIDINGLHENDTVRFQYLGYEARNLCIAEAENDSIIFLKQDFLNLNETLIYGNPPDPEFIVKKILENKDSNYRKTGSKKQAFIRQRDISDMNNFKLNYKKSSIDGLDEKMLKKVEEKIPRHSTSFTDFLGNLYFTQNLDDSVKLKIEPIHAVSLKEKDIAEFDQFEKVFENAFKSTGDKEYWKIKTGIFGTKIDQSDMNNDTIKDSLPDNQRNLKYFSGNMQSQLYFSSLNGKDDWEFLYKTGRYNYKLVGGTSVNGEDVYIIDFSPRSSGMYIGRIYVSAGTYALLRADYEYAPGKTGRDIHLLGVGYTETQFSGSIYFERKNDNYELKYFSKKAGATVSFDRNIALLKKRKRTFFDKTLNEFKVGLDIKVDEESSYEYLVLDEGSLTEPQFQDFKQPENMEVIYVDQFDDNLWKGYSIIEPVERMKEYKKQKVDYTE